jgi:hypothetical protein
MADETGNLSIAGQYLRQVRDRLLEIDATMRRSPSAAREVGREQIAAWNEYSQLVSLYQRFRVLLGLSEESGLSMYAGLGVIQLAVGGLTIVVFLGLVAALLTTVGYLWQRARQAEANETAISTAVAEQRGAPTGTTYTAVPAGDGVVVIPAGQASSPTSETNWPLIVFGGLFGFLLLRALFGK